MTEDEGSFTLWTEPATKGDLVTAMIWTGALVTKAISVALGAATADNGETLKKNYAEYQEERDEFKRIYQRIGGWSPDGD